MPFSGKATYSGGGSLPEIAEDVSDLVSINAIHETPLLDVLGDAPRPARSTLHEWLEDVLLLNTGVIGDNTFTNATTDTSVNVVDTAVFRVGDQIRVKGSTELMLVTGTNGETGAITVVRGYGGSTAAALVSQQPVDILGNAALEGADADTARFTTRYRQSNYTQIFASTVEVSGSELAVTQLGVADELDYQKQQRTRELLRDLENCVINGRAPTGAPLGNQAARRTMRGIVGFITTNIFKPGVDSFPAGATLVEPQLNEALRRIWVSSAGNVDLIVVGGPEKRAINQFITSNRRFTSTDDNYRDAVAVYESDFGVCRIVLSRWVPQGTVLLLDSSRIDVLPLAGRSFQYKPLAVTGDRQNGQVLGEYTLEFRNESAHGLIQF